MIRQGGIGTIEEGKLKGRKFIIPSEVWVEKGTYLNGIPEFAKACIIHHTFVPDEGCGQCEQEIKRREEENKLIGL